MPKIVVLVLGILLVVSLLLNIRLLGNQKEPDRAYKVTQIIDGDTFKIEGGQKIRLFGLDAPENGRCMADEAKNLLEKELSGKEVKLTDQFPDVFHRQVANIFVGDKYINEIIVAKGFARPDYEPNPYKQRIVDAYTKARKEKLGVNSSQCIRFKQIDPKCAVKANVPRETKERYYYLPACKNYMSVRVDTSSLDQWFCSEKEAKQAGFVKAPTCK